MNRSFEKKSSYVHFSDKGGRIYVNPSEDFLKSLKGDIVPLKNSGQLINVHPLPPEYWAYKNGQIVKASLEEQKINVENKDKETLGKPFNHYMEKIKKDIEDLSSKIKRLEKSRDKFFWFNVISTVVYFVYLRGVLNGWW